jgi:general secretion pathway protein G
MIASQLSQQRSAEPDSRQRGFTLIELLIVVVILGILAGIAVFAVQGMTSNSVQQACRADFKSVEVAIESYKAQEGFYPTASSGHGISGSDAVPGLLQGDPGPPALGPWLRDTPTNGNHYRIEADTLGNGTVQVWKADGSGKIGTSGTIADCGQVS